LFFSVVVFVVFANILMKMSLLFLFLLCSWWFCMWFHGCVM